MWKEGRREGREGGKGGAKKSPIGGPYLKAEML